MFIAPTEELLPMLTPPPRLLVRPTTWWAYPDTTSTTAAPAQATAYASLPAISEPLPNTLVLLRLIGHRSGARLPAGIAPRPAYGPFAALVTWPATNSSLIVTSIGRTANHISAANSTWP